MRASRRLLASVVVLTAAAAVLGAQQPSVFSPSGTTPVLESYLESLRLQTGIPGMSAAIVHEREVAWERGFGFANVAARIRATPDTPYLLGDATGTFAATLLLQCVEQRRLTLDEPLQRLGLP